jgi:hypothetical protein
MKIARRVRASGSFGWLTTLGLVVPALVSPGCGRRAYPAHDPVSFAQTDGAVEVSGTFNQCPDLTVSVSPGDGPPGTPFTVHGATSDADGNPVTLSLHADSGSFSMANQLPSIFMCSQPGLIAITVIASDGSCQTTKSVSIFCLGTHADAGTSDGAAVDARRDGATGGDGSSDAGTTVVTNTCPDEYTSGGQACTDCTVSNCSLAPNPNGTDGCCGLSSVADQLLCIAAVQCFSKNNCAVGGDPNRCFCGNAGSMCYSVPGAANGPCVAEVFGAAKKSDVTMVKALFTSPASPLGRAVNLLGCRGGLCMSECNLP